MQDRCSDAADDGFEELVLRATTGESAARAELVERCRGPLLGRIRLLMGEQARGLAESSDVLQDTFAAALGSLPKFEMRGPAQFLNWLTTIARNKIRQDLRRRREQTLSSLSSSLSGQPQHESDSKAWFDELLRLAQVLESLSEPERTAIELHDLQGLPFDELARRLECSERHARRIHAQALLHLGRALRERRPS